MPTPIGLLRDPVSLAVLDMLIVLDISQAIDTRKPKLAISQRSS
ncbi:MAG: hypothetical protein PVH25_15245 [Burkholderiales bacterium]|jgi:16S rRNA C1402 (ribose-2'-O) methylase RsmI